MLVGGRDVKQLPLGDLRHAMASVPQDMVLFNDTIYYNIAYGNLNASKADVEAAATAAQVGWKLVFESTLCSLDYPLKFFHIY